MGSRDLLDKIAAIYTVDPEKGNEFLKSLYEASESTSVLEKAKKTKSQNSDWKASEDLTDKQKEEIAAHMEDGYSEREAHRHAGAYKEEGDFQQALKSHTNPSMMSDKMIDKMKGLAKEWLGNADKHEKLNANIEKNPMKHASGKMLAAHEEHMGDYKKAYNDFLGSDDVKELSGRDRHKAVKEWKKQYREENPDHSDKIANVSQSQQSVGEARQTGKQSLQDKLSNIISGGFSPDETHDAEAGAQHAGISLGREGEAATGKVARDPMSAFAGGNQKLVSMLSDEQKERFDRIGSAAATHGKERVPEAAAEKPKQRIVIRRKKDGGQ